MRNEQVAECIEAAPALRPVKVAPHACALVAKYVALLTAAARHAETSQATQELRSDAFDLDIDRVFNRILFILLLLFFGEATINQLLFFSRTFLNLPTSILQH